MSVDVTCWNESIALADLIVPFRCWSLFKAPLLLLACIYSDKASQSHPLVSFCVEKRERRGERLSETETKTGDGPAFTSRPSLEI